jgi:hypothetical protein
MSQQGPCVKVVDGSGFLRTAGIMPPYKRNETSPAQYVESCESEQTQPLVVLPEGLTAQKKLQQKQLGDRREAFPVQRRRTILAQRCQMVRRAIAFVLFPTIMRMLLGGGTHHPVTMLFGDN